MSLWKNKIQFLIIYLKATKFFSYKLLLGLSEAKNELKSFALISMNYYHYPTKFIAPFS